jgi:3-hydroxyacyl-CoA dehydrogenase/enoyl-CoA hydratase/carnithine racemase
MVQEKETIDAAVTDGVAFLRINNLPVNQLSETLRSDLQQVFQEAFADDDVQAIVISGTGKNFIAGADIKEIQNIPDKTQFLQGVLAYDEFYNAIENASKPVIAAINGPALGGGLEFAMACHYRLAAQDVKVGQPEVQVGLIPGAGGTQRLPRLAGLSTALEMITTGRAVAADEAMQLSILDEVVSPENLEDRAMEAVKEFVRGEKAHASRRTRDRLEQLPSAAEKKEILSAAKKKVQKKAKGFSAPLKAVEAMEKGLSGDFQADLQNEAELFVDCATSQEAKNMIGVFLNTRSAGKIQRLEGVAPQKVQKVAMLGLGVMGSGIANLLLSNGYEAVLWEVNDNALEKGIAAVRKTFSYLVKKGKMTEDDVEALFRKKALSTTRIADVAGADLVIEAVIEDMEVKKDLWSQVDGICGREAIFATNTSALPITEMASCLREPGRMIGLHFFNPAERMQLLEVVSGRQSSNTALATAVDFSRRIKKIPVVVNDGPGFYVSRQLNALMGECNFMLGEGYPMGSVDGSLVEFGMPMGPLTLHDLTGIDIGYHVACNFENAFGKRWKVSELHKRIYETGCYGRKTGSGYYDYSGEKPSPNPKVLEVIDRYLQEKGIKRIPVSEVDLQQFIERMMARAINEAAYMMEEGICDRPWDIDLAMVYGCGFPAYKGGIMRYADAWGLENVLAALEAYTKVHGERFRPCGMIEQMARKGETFYSN